MVTLDDCERAYKQFVSAYGEMSWSVLGNDALKALREMNEFEWTPQVTKVHLFCEEIMLIPKMDHDKEGAGYAMNQTEKVPWSWKVMVWMLNKNTRENFAKGGIVDFWFAWKDEVDHLRLGADGIKKHKNKPKVWDFYIKRSDGKTYLLHPLTRPSR